MSSVIEMRVNEVGLTQGLQEWRRLVAAKDWSAASARDLDNYVEAITEWVTRAAIAEDAANLRAAVMLLRDSGLPSQLSDIADVAQEQLGFVKEHLWWRTVDRSALGARLLRWMNKHHGRTRKELAKELRAPVKQVRVEMEALSDRFLVYSQRPGFNKPPVWWLTTEGQQVVEAWRQS